MMKEVETQKSALTLTWQKFLQIQLDFSSLSQQRRLKGRNSRRYILKYKNGVQKLFF